jgi:hypothetical protein
MELCQVRMRKASRVILCLIIFISLSACFPLDTPTPASPWSPTDLRALDPADADQANHDLVAIYTRSTDFDLQIRLDLLDLPPVPDADIYLILDTLRSGVTESPLNSDTNPDWDLLLVIPADEMPYTIQSETQRNSSIPIIPRVIRDPVLDTITISLNRHLLPNLKFGFSIQAFIVPTGSSTGADQIGPVWSDTQITERAPVLLAFWNSLPAHTPVQALRRWDGAHTGPLGERHGLGPLVNAAERYQVPLTLLDLKLPTSLSALDYLGKTRKIISLVDRDLILLPEALPEAYFGYPPDWTTVKAAEKSRVVAEQFGFFTSSILYAPYKPSEPLPGYRLTILRDTPNTESDTLLTHINRWKNQALLTVPLDGEIPIQATEEGLSLEVRRALLGLAQNNGQKHSCQLMVLGGNLPNTTWGDPQAAKAALRYIATHPWIQALDENELLTFPQTTGQTQPPISPLSQEIGNNQLILLDKLGNAPPGRVTELAWDFYLSLLTPAYPTIKELPALRANYIGHLGNLLSAVSWEHQPTTIQDCTIDTDLDGHPECILASNDLYALIDPQGASLLLLFYRTTNGVHQIIGPSSQMLVGLGDHTSWKLDQGFLGDPTVIPGAFAGPWEPYQVTPVAQGYQFKSASIEKEIKLNGNGLRLDYRSASPTIIQIPLMISPEWRFNPDWWSQYTQESLNNGWSWRIKGGPEIIVRSSTTLSIQSFIAPQTHMALPENPNKDYPSGYFLPFPLAVISTNPEEALWIEMRLTP